MIFCPKCGSILKPRAENGKKMVACSCGYKSKVNGSLTLKETMKVGRDIEVVSEEKTVLPLTSAVCPKCGHERAYFWTVQTRAGDEPETKFLRCQECKHTWRDYS